MYWYVFCNVKAEPAQEARLRCFLGQPLTYQEMTHVLHGNPTIATSSVTRVLDFETAGNVP